MPTTLIPTSLQGPVLALVILGGAIAWAMGYRLFRVVLTVFGFYIGALAATAVLGPGDRTLLVATAIGGGAVGAAIMFFGYFVGVALVGAGVGALGVHMIWNRLGTDPHAFVVILAAVAGAATAMALQRYVIVATTAFAGGWTILWGTMTFLDRGAPGARRPPVWMVYPLDMPSGSRWAVAVWVAIGLAGVFIQMRYTGRLAGRGKGQGVRGKG